MKHDFQWMYQISASLNHQLRLVARGASGADRRDKQRLRRQLAALKAESNLLNQELAQVRRQLSLENRGLKTRYEELKAERDDLQLEIWELEDLIEELFGLLTTAEVLPADALSETAQIPKLEHEPASAEVQPLVSLEKNSKQLATVDLAGIKLALVGGHDSTRRGVISKLSQQHGLTQWVELPPFSKHSLGRSNIKAKIHDCDLIVLITGYMRHKQTESIGQLKKLGTLPGDVLLLRCRGKSGVVREILTYISQKNC